MGYCEKSLSFKYLRYIKLGYGYFVLVFFCDIDGFLFILFIL